MKVLIVEDEGIAADRLQKLLAELEPTAEVVEHVDSVKSAVRWFQANSSPDLAFFDIQLADGKSFEIFEQVEVKCPIIFTTAYDQYAIQAFKVNSVDYLLKPVPKDDLTQALTKFKSASESTAPIDPNVLMQLLDQSTNKYKERFVVKVGEHLKSVMVADISVIYSEDKSTYALTNSEQKFILDFTLDNIENMIDPRQFFRVNRKYIVAIDSLKDILTYSSSRLKLTLKNYESQDLVVSRDRVGEFKSWLDR